MLLRATRLSAIANAVRNLFRGASLNMNFAGADTLDPRITFTRASGATRVNASGVIEAVAIDGPRFDYDPVTLAPKGLLIEEQRTNLLTYSSEFDNAAWFLNGCTIGANQSESPNGTQDADAVISGGTGAAEKRVNQNFSGGVLITNYAFSIYAKKGAVDLIAVTLFDSGSRGVRRIFSLVDGSAVSNLDFGSPTSPVASITDAGNGWWRVTVGLTTSLAGALGTRVQPIGVAGSLSYAAADSTSAQAFLWGAQLEAGAFATSYIPTTTAAATRAADVAVMTGANFSNWYRQDEGTLFAEASSYAGGGATQRRLLVLDDGGTSNRMTLRYEPLMANAGFTSSVAGTLVANIQSGVALSANVPHKNAGTYKTDDYAFALGGSPIGADTSGAVPVVNAARLGQGSTGEHLNGHIRRISYFPRRLSNSELEGITK